MRLVCCAVLAACGPPPSVRCHDRIAPGELVITEVFARYAAPRGESGGDRGHEWFEIYNASDRELELAGLELASSRAGSELKHRVAALAVAPHQYATFGDVPPDALVGYLDYGYGDDLGTFADSGSASLALRCGSTEIASVTYVDTVTGHSRELAAGDAPTAERAADPAAWCDAVTPFEQGNFATPRGAGDCLPRGECLDGGVARAMRPPAPGELVITEVMPSPTEVPDATGEWFEAIARADFDLAGVAVDRQRDDRMPDVIDTQTCMPVAAGRVVVFARSRDATVNGGLPDAAIAGTFRFSLVAGTAAAPGDVRVIAAEAVIDAVTWSGAIDGFARSLDPGATDATANDAPAAWCDATAVYGPGDRGTPGVANPRCPPP